MNTIELIKDAAFFGGNIPNERLKECRDFFDNVIEKQLHIGGVIEPKGTLPKPQICYKTNEICTSDCKGLCRNSC